MKSDVIELDGAVEHRTEKAVFFHTGIKEEGAWLPLSQIEIHETGIGGIQTVVLPEWLALDKGLI